MRIETVHPKEIGPSEAALWRAHRAADVSLRSPYFAPEWAALMGEVRDDARVAVMDGGRGFFAAQKLSRFAAMNLGAPIADYQGVIAASDLDFDPAALCRALGVGRIDLTHVPEGNPILAHGCAGTEGSWIVDTSSSRELYEAGLKLRRAEFVRQTDKKQRKLNREKGEVRFSVSTDRAVFDTMLKWKNEQLIRSGQPAVWSKPWVHAVLERTFESHDAQFGGVMFAMHVGDQLVAASYCLRGGASMNYWIVVHDSAFDAYSPGVQLTRWAIGWAGEHGVTEIDFGPGDYQYKRQLATGQRQIQFGAATQMSWSGALRRTQYALRAQMERLPQPALAALPGKAMRKLDLMRALAA